MDRKTFRDISYGVYIVGTAAQGKLAGCVVNTVMQVCSDDPMICVAINKQNATNAAVHASKRFSIAILSEDVRPDVIGTFGFHSSSDTDKFADVQYEMVDDVPVIEEGIMGWMVCDVMSVTDAGTHEVFLGHVIDAERLAGGHQMTYEYYHNVVKGASPKSAPTYEPPTKEEAEAMGEQEMWVCDVCGYVYIGDLTKEPDDWTCPVCGVDKSHFQRS